MVLACKTEEGEALWIRSHGDGHWRGIERMEGGHRPFFLPMDRGSRSSVPGICSNVGPL